MRKREFRAINKQVLVPVTGECLCLGYRKPRELKAEVSTFWPSPTSNSPSRSPSLTFHTPGSAHHSQFSGQTGFTLLAEVPVSVMIMILGLGHRPGLTLCSGPQAHRGRKDALSDRQELGV